MPNKGIPKKRRGEYNRKNWEKEIEEYKENFFKPTNWYEELVYIRRILLGPDATNLGSSLLRW